MSIKLCKNVSMYSKHLIWSIQYSITKQRNISDLFSISRKTFCRISKKFKNLAISWQRIISRKTFFMTDCTDFFRSVRKMTKDGRKLMSLLPTLIWQSYLRKFGLDFFRFIFFMSSCSRIFLLTRIKEFD